MHRKPCRDCGQPIDLIRTTTDNDSWLPVDPYPQEGGNVLLQRTPDGLRARVLGPIDRIEQARIHPLYKSHHATCPKRREATDTEPVPAAPVPPAQPSLLDQEGSS